MSTKFEVEGIRGERAIELAVVDDPQAPNRRRRPTAGGGRGEGVGNSLEKVWTLPDNAAPGSTLKVYKWVKTDRQQVSAMGQINE